MNAPGAQVPSPVPRGFVIGLGEVGRRIAGALAAAGTEVVPITREAGWETIDPAGDEPIVLCVREEALAGVLERLAGCDPARLVLTENGWLRPLLRGRDAATRGLIWFTAKGEFFRALRESVFGGPLAVPLSAALRAGGLAAEALVDRAFRAAEAEKMGFNCVVGLPLAVHGVSLAEYLDRRGDEARALFDESTAVCARALGVEPAAEWWDEFRRAVEPIGWVRASVPKALDFRNAAVLRLARDLEIATPITARLLAAAGHPGGPATPPGA